MRNSFVYLHYNKKHTLLKFKQKKMDNKTTSERDLINENLERAKKIAIDSKIKFIRIITSNSRVTGPPELTSPEPYTFGFDSNATNWDLEYEFNHDYSAFTAKVVSSIFY